MITEDQAEIVEFLASPSSAWRRRGRADRDTRIDRLPRRGERVEAETRGPIRLPRFLHSRSPQGDVRGRAPHQSAHGAGRCIAASSPSRASRTDRWRSAGQASRLTGCSRWPASIKTGCSIDWPRKGRWISA